MQGVGFRWWTHRKASGLGLRGTVGNCADGTVEVHAAGDVEALETLADGLRQGPVIARVDGVAEVRSDMSLPARFEIV